MKINIADKLFTHSLADNQNMLIDPNLTTELIHVELYRLVCCVLG